MFRIVTAILILLTLTACTDNGATSGISMIPMKVMYSAWQGVASDGRYIYITSDRDGNFNLSNTISVYGVDGKFIYSLPKAYKKTDSNGNFMSFGDCTVINDSLYATVYNFNSGAKKTVSRVVKYDLPNLKMVAEYEIGDGTAESVTQKDSFFWVVYHDKNNIAKFDLNFKLINEFPLLQQFEEEGGYQGIFFIGNDLFVNLHGSNKFNEKYAQGLDHYKYDGDTFTFVERIKPPVYGAGQGIEYYGGKYYWVDRPGNSIVIRDKLK
ncbi:hypothetical protein [Paenibacillus sp. URB8-2]|uniref:hypothetical protein n=1 Tax=Paenibacillus sp. URB8-2 TaxID=2741301 RepID=UPI0015B7A8DF|nr:hypothetical protein [Paenibacillus sp. URB8-2]BCG61272.1 hypothetical protein PUR_46970 [Paenibacillus sp. URB8-2]